MLRRSLLKALAALPFAARAAHAAPPKSMKEIESLQKNCRKKPSCHVCIPPLT